MIFSPRRSLHIGMRIRHLSTCSISISSSCATACLHHCEHFRFCGFAQVFAPRFCLMSGGAGLGIFLAKFWLIRDLGS